MVLWGIVWGGILGGFWPGGDTGFQVGCGAALGGIAGIFLRKGVRDLVEREVARRLAAVAATTAGAAHAAGGATLVGEPVAARTAAAPAASPPVEPPAAAPLPAAPLASPPDASTAPAGPARPALPAPPTPIDRLLAVAKAWLLGGNTIVRMGIVVLFVGLAFLAKYAVDNALVPPQVRLAAIAAAGIGLLVGGWQGARRADRRAYALSLQGAGVAVLYLTVFAAFRLYQVLPPGAALGVLAAVCALSTAIALAQDALPMAFIGFAGAFAAPLLVATGQGDHVGLFAYYLLLGVAIVAIAWVRAWRPLNLLGFVATFAVATAWGVLQYRPDRYASTQPFLAAFFAVYVAAAVLYATRHGLAARRAVDGTLVFGVPIVAFGLQAGLVRHLPLGAAFSALALSAVYLILAASLLRRAARAGQGSRWLGECFAALGLGFLTLAVPLALDARWTSAAWAVEGAAVHWMGRRQGRWLPRAAGLALQLLASLAYLDGVEGQAAAPWPVANPAFLGAVMLAGAALALAWWTRDPAPGPASWADERLQRLERRLSLVLLWVGFLWLQFGVHQDVTRQVLDGQGLSHEVVSTAAQAHLTLLAWVGTAFALHLLASPARARPWPVAATPAWTVGPVLLLGAAASSLALPHVFVHGGWIAWPLLLGLQAVLLKRLDAGEPARWWHAVHAAGVWLLLLLGGNLLWAAIRAAHLGGTAWAAVIPLAAATLVLLALCHPAWHAAQPRRWPLDRHARAYAWTAGAPLAACVAAGALLVAVQSDGTARPLPYVPFLNPTDLALALALGTCALWLLRTGRGANQARLARLDRGARVALGAIAFIGINTVWLRTVHHHAGVAWNGPQLFASFLVQAGYSILWTLLALGLMLAAHRLARRGMWMVGAGLLAATVAKLFLVDLSNRGGSERIVVFIAVGVLMLVVGYVAPLPPAVRQRPLAAGEAA